MFFFFFVCVCVCVGDGGGMGKGLVFFFFKFASNRPSYGAAICTARLLESRKTLSISFCWGSK